MMPRLLAASIVMMLVAIPAAVGQVTPSDLSEAEERLAEVRAELRDLTDRYEAALARDVELSEAIVELELAFDDRTAEAEALRDELEARIVDMYTGAAETGLAALISGDEPAEVETRNQYLRDMGVADRSLLSDLEVITRQIDAEAAELEIKRTEQQAALADLETVAEDLNTRLADAQADYETLYAQFLEEERQRQEEARRRAEAEAARQAAEEEAARQATSTTAAPDDGSTPTTAPADTTTTTTAAPPPTSGGMRCPIDGFTSFSDTWGAPRSGGRFHQGLDMLAARGTPVVAVGAGEVLRMRNGGLGGITVWLETDNGDEFYYAHLDSWASGLSAGQRVGAGDLLGTVGTTGNAPAHVPHLHWEYHPGGGGAVNPTPLARDLCG